MYAVETYYFVQNVGQLQVSFCDRMNHAKFDIVNRFGQWTTENVQSICIMMESSCSPHAINLCSSLPLIFNIISGFDRILRVRYDLSNSTIWIMWKSEVEDDSYRDECMEWGGYRHQGVSITIDHMGLVFAFFQHKKKYSFFYFLISLSVKGRIDPVESKIIKWKLKRTVSIVWYMKIEWYCWHSIKYSPPQTGQCGAMNEKKIHSI